MGDLRERAFWPDYQSAFEEMLSATSTRWAPWWVIPADHKWMARAVVSAILTHEIEGLGVRRPTVTAEQKRLLARARRQLLAER
jgi:polyphosphate kinase 2 (PPK2 family)